MDHFPRCAVVTTAVICLQQWATTVICYKPVITEAILWPVIPLQVYLHLHLRNCFLADDIYLFILKWWKRNVIMSGSCSHSEAKSLQPLFNTWENTWLQETLHLQMLPIITSTSPFHLHFSNAEQHWKDRFSKQLNPIGNHSAHSHVPEGFN